jgi:hypothetical protein
MRTKKSFSFDEEKDAEKLYNTGFPDGNIDYGKMYILAKYIRQTFDYGEIRLEKAVIKFCKAQNKNFNPITEADSIKKWVRSALNYDLRKIENVTVSEKEINVLKKIESNKDKKLLFVLLVFSKALKKGSVKRDKTNLKTSDNYYIHYNNFLDIIRLSKFTNTSEIDLADIIYKYKHLFTFYKPERELIRLEFIDKNPKKQIIISDLNNITNFYSILFEKKKTEYKEQIGKCTICGKEFIKKSNRQRVCEEDTIILERERKTRWRNKQTED